ELPALHAGHRDQARARSDDHRDHRRHAGTGAGPARPQPGRGGVRAPERQMTTASELIVCGTDFSEESASALEWAAAFARRQGARIDLVHVLPEPTQDREALAADAVTFEAARRQDAHDQLAALAAATVRAAGVTVQPHLLTGAAEVAVVEHARSHEARLIVVGAGGLPVIERWVLGSVAERTVRSARCPVAVVPRHERNHAWFASQTGATPPLKALVGLEGDEG